MTFVTFWNCFCSITASVPAFMNRNTIEYYADGMFPNPALEEFHPDILYIHTSNRNIEQYPSLEDDRTLVTQKLQAEYERFQALWEHLHAVYGCPVVQNNFEPPLYRLLGNRDASDHRGRWNYIQRLNQMFYEYADTHQDFYIHDICYEAADYGLERWSDPFYWNMYKYAMCVPAIPYTAFQLARIIKSIFGRNKKVLNLDLDNTLWGGVIGDDGPENIEIGQETSLGQTYAEFQDYLKQHKKLGVLLSVNSKNNEDTALSGLERADSVLKREDFVAFRANWEPKSHNLYATAEELKLLPESFVFVDDNPAEREIVRQEVPGAAVPEITKVEEYIRVLDRSGFFEVTNFSEDDLKRNEMYLANEQRNRMQKNFSDYGDYLRSLEMKAQIGAFDPAYFSRIAQLTNKSNQFNLTTQRYSQSEIEQIAADPQYLTLCGRLEDKFGDNGVVSIVIGRKEKDVLQIELWLMSCRVLKRDMEYAMMDTLVKQCRDCGIRQIYGYFYPTAKNAMVKDFYALQGFEKLEEDVDGNAKWSFRIPEQYTLKNRGDYSNGKL